MLCRSALGRSAQLAVCMLLGPAIAWCAEPEQPRDLDALMRVMAETPGVVAEFVETKHIAVLEEPLETRGTLYFIPPRRLARRTSQPDPSSLIIDGDRLVFVDATGEQQIDLASNPIAKVFVDNFIVLFNGDRVELERRYRVRFEAGDTAWSLELTPKGAPLDEFIASVHMQGNQNGMRSMTLREAGGDYTTTVFTELDADHRFTADEIATAFSAATPEAP